MLKKKLYRRTSHKYLTGLAGGIADYLEIDATVIRIVLVCLGVATLGVLLLVYFVASYFVPKLPTTSIINLKDPTPPLPK